MNTYPLDMNTKLGAINNNMRKPNIFRVKGSDDQINGLLNRINTRRMDKVEYHCVSINLDGNVGLTKYELIRFFKDLKPNEYII